MHPPYPVIMKLTPWLCRRRCTAAFDGPLTMSLTLMFVAVQAAREAALRAKRRNDGRIPPYPGMNSRVPSSGRLVDLSHGHGSPGTSTPPLAGNGRAGADRTGVASLMRVLSSCDLSGHATAACCLWNMRKHPCISCA